MPHDCSQQQSVCHQAITGQFVNTRNFSNCQALEYSQMHRNFEDRTPQRPKSKPPHHFMKLNLVCPSPRANQSGFISGMTLDEYFSTVREATEPQADSECSDLIGNTAIRELDEDDYSSSKDLGDSSRHLLSQRQDTKNGRDSEPPFKLPLITQNTFAPKKVQIPPLSISTKQRMSIIRTLYGSINFKKSVRKGKKEDHHLHTMTLSSFNKQKKPMLTRRDKSEVFDNKMYQGSALETMRYSKERVALRE